MEDNRVLQQMVMKVDTEKKRLSMENEQLSWKMSQSFIGGKDFSVLNTPDGKYIMKDTKKYMQTGLKLQFLPIIYSFSKVFLFMSDFMQIRSQSGSLVEVSRSHLTMKHNHVVNFILFPLLLNLSKSHNLGTSGRAKS